MEINTNSNGLVSVWSQVISFQWFNAIRIIQTIVISIASLIPYANSWESIQNGCNTRMGASEHSVLTISLYMLRVWPGLALHCTDHRYSHQSYQTWSKREPLRHLPNYNRKTDPHPFSINTYSVFFNFHTFQCWTAQDSSGQHRTQ